MKNDMDAQVLRSSTAISFHKFQLLKNRSEYAFFFVEGDDDNLFYPSKSRGRFSDKQVLPLSCGGKNGVLEIYEMTKDDIIDSRVIGYFVDRDFDGNEDVCERVYVTPFYAVENLVFNKSTFVNVLHEKFGLNISEDEYTAAEDLYNKRASEFYSALSLYNSWMYTQRNLPEERKTKSLNFPKNIPDGFVLFEKDKISGAYSLEDIKKNHPGAPEVTELEIENSATIINSENPEQRYRGKFHWALFTFILSCLVEDANKKGGGEILKKRVKFNFSKNDKRKLFEETYHFASIPDCLDNYLNTIAA